jgi:tetratricopeptide (TPR) repeat protein
MAQFLKVVLLLAFIPTVSHAQVHPGERANVADSLSIPEPVNHFVVHGSVVLPSGVAPGRLVAVALICAGGRHEVTYADAKGRFSFDFGALDRRKGAASTSNLWTCSIRASLDGYHPQAIALESFIKAGKENLGKLELQPIGRQASAVISATDMEVPKNAREDYDEGLDAAAKMKWPEAISAIAKATAAYPKFATAWLSLGMLQVSQNDAAAALDSFTQAIAADNKFAAAYVELAALQLATGQWSQAAESAGKAIALDPDGFPRAYYVAAVADGRLNLLDARKSTSRQGFA